MPTITAPNLEEESRPVPLGDIEAELTRRVLAVREAGDPLVLRARMSNLILYGDDPAHAATLAEKVPEISSLHPARVFLLVARDGPEDGELTATVAVRERAAGTERTAASELITLRASGRAVHRLPYVVRGLMLGNLPTNLWWTSATPPALAGPILDDLAEHAEQLLYDSLGWADPMRGLQATAAWLEPFERASGISRSRRVVSDLSWRRLKGWRRLLAQALDPNVAPGLIDSIREVDVAHGPHAAVEAALLVGWLASCLGWRVHLGAVRRPDEMTWECAGPRGPIRVRLVRMAAGPSELAHLRIACTHRESACHLDVGVEDDGRRLTLRHEGISDAAPRTVTLPPQPLAEIVGRQLSDRDRDPAFQHALAAAGALARAVVA